MTRLLFLFLFLWTSLAQAHSLPMLQKILKAGEIRVGTTGDYPPFSGRNLDNDSYEGFSIDVATELAKDLGVKVRFVQATWPTLAAGMNADKYDIALSGISRTLERLKSVGFSKPIYAPAIVPLVRKEDKNRFKSLQDLDKPGVRIATQLGTASEESARRYFTKAEIYSVDYPVIDYTEVVAGRADAAFSIGDYFQNIIEASQPDIYLLEPTPQTTLAKTFIAAMIPQNSSSAFVNWINGWIDEKAASGFLDRLAHKYKFSINK